MEWTYLFFASLTFVFLKAFQQLNVQKSRYLWVMPTSMLMAVTEVVVVIGVARSQSWIVAIPIGLGAGLGCMLAMWLHGVLSNGRESGR